MIQDGKIAVGISFYNVAKELDRGLASLPTDVIKICVDGKYAKYGNADDPGLSFDGSRDVVNSFPNTVLVDAPNTFEHLKRQKYADLTLELGCDYLIIMDSDEFIDSEQTNWDAFKQDLEMQCLSDQFKVYNIFGAMVEQDSPDYVDNAALIMGRPSIPPRRPGKPRDYQYKPRVWHRPWEVEYFLSHYQFKRKSIGHDKSCYCPPCYLSKQLSNACVCVIKGLYIRHDHALRDKNTMQRRLDYQKWLVPFEQTKVTAYYREFQKLPDDLTEIERWYNDTYLVKQTVH